MNSVTAFIIKYKWVIIAVIVLIILLYIAYRRGASYRPKEVKLPPDTQGSSGNTGSGTFDPTQYTDNIFTDIDCWLCTHSSSPYTAANTLSNTQVAAIWNDWNRRYYEKAGNKNLCQAISSEWTIGYGWNAAWAEAAGTLGARFKSLGYC